MQFLAWLKENKERVLDRIAEAFDDDLMDDAIDDGTPDFEEGVVEMERYDDETDGISGMMLLEDGKKVIVSVRVID